MYEFMLLFDAIGAVCIPTGGVKLETATPSPSRIQETPQRASQFSQKEEGIGQGTPNRSSRRKLIYGDLDILDADIT